MSLGPALLAAATYLGIGMLLGSAVMWSMVLGRWRRGEAILPQEPRRPAPWMWPEVVFVALAYLGLQLGVSQIAIQFWSESNRDVLLLPSAAVAGALAALFTVLWLRSVSHADGADLGVDLRQWRRDLRLGLAGFLFVVPPALALQWLLSRWFTGQHEIVKLLQQYQDGTTVALAWLAAVVVAPVVEELLFRVVLQGWLERAFTKAPANPVGATAGQPLSPYLPPSSPEAALHIDNPYASPTAETPLPGVAASGDVVVWLPILISSSIFAALHFNGGPDPIPLFLLAIVLGYLYQRTHRLWPGVVLHATLNGLSLLMLMLGADGLE